MQTGFCLFVCLFICLFFVVFFCFVGFVCVCGGGGGGLFLVGFFFFGGRGVFVLFFALFLRSQ